MTRLLFDANLPPKLARAIGQFPGIETESLLKVGLERLRDEQVVSYAARSGYVIVTLDSDFAALFSRTAHPPVSVIYIRVSNEHRRTPALLSILTRFVNNHLGILSDGPVFVTLTPETIAAVRYAESNDRP